MALELARAIRAPSLDRTGDAAVLAVAAVPGPVPEEWSCAAPGVWIAGPDAAGAGVCAEIMTAAEARDLPAVRDHG